MVPNVRMSDSHHRDAGVARIWSFTRILSRRRRHTARVVDVVRPPSRSTRGPHARNHGRQGTEEDDGEEDDGEEAGGEEARGEAHRGEEDDGDEEACGDEEAGGEEACGEEACGEEYVCDFWCAARACRRGTRGGGEGIVREL